MKPVVDNSRHQWFFFKYLFSFSGSMWMFLYSISMAHSSVFCF